MLEALVMSGDWSTIRVKLCVASGETPLEAVIVIRYEPAVSNLGVPDSVAVSSPSSLKLTPVGSAPVSDNDAVGVPELVTVNEPAVPTTKVVLGPLVIAGAWSTIVSAIPTPHVTAADALLESPP